MTKEKEKQWGLLDGDGMGTYNGGSIYSSICHGSSVGKGGTYADN